jgi:hypothetical protein
MTNQTRTSAVGRRPNTQHSSSSFSPSATNTHPPTHSKNYSTQPQNASPEQTRPTVQSETPTITPSKEAVTNSHAGTPEAAHTQLEAAASTQPETTASVEISPNKFSPKGHRNNIPNSPASSEQLTQSFLGEESLQPVHRT